MQQQSATAPATDEISLIDLLRVLLKRRKTLYLTFLLVFGTAFAYAILLPSKYEYATTIEIGTIVRQTPQGEQTILIDEPQTVAAKLQNSYIPLVLHDYAQAHPGDPARYELKVEVPKNSELVVVKGKGSEDKEKTYIELLTDSVAKLVKDHERLMNIARSQLEAKLVQVKLALSSQEDDKTLNVLKSDYEQKIQAAKAKIEDSQDQIELATKKKRRLDDKAKLLENQIKDLSKNIQDSLHYRQAAKKDLQNGSDAMTMLLIDNEIQQNQNQLSDLRSQLQVDLKNEQEDYIRQIESQTLRKEVAVKELNSVKDSYEKALKDYRRDLIQRRQDVKEAETRLENSKQTAALVAPMRSNEPVGISKRNLIVLGIFLGLFLAIFAAFIHEFLANIRQQMEAPGAE